MAGIERFVNAQDTGEFDAALSEIKAGQKLGHWIWFVFPQLAGLGVSEMSQLYGVRGRDEAIAYLRHPILRPRLEAITRAAAEHLKSGVRVERLMGSSIDAQKLVSSMTLFGKVARELETAGEQGVASIAKLAEEILGAAEGQGYSRCRYTSERLADR